MAEVEILDQRADFEKEWDEGNSKLNSKFDAIVAELKSIQSMLRMLNEESDHLCLNPESSAFSGNGNFDSAMANENPIEKVLESEDKSCYDVIEQGNEDVAMQLEADSGKIVTSNGESTDESTDPNLQHDEVQQVECFTSATSFTVIEVNEPFARYMFDELPRQLLVEHEEGSGGNEDCVLPFGCMPLTQDLGYDATEVGSIYGSYESRFDGVTMETKAIFGKRVGKNEACYVFEEMPRPNSVGVMKAQEDRSILNYLCSFKLGDITALSDVDHKDIGFGAMGVKEVCESLFPDTMKGLYGLRSSNAINSLFQIHVIELETYECKYAISFTDIDEMFYFDPGGCSWSQMCSDPFEYNGEKGEFRLTLIVVDTLVEAIRHKCGILNAVFRFTVEYISVGKNVRKIGLLTFQACDSEHIPLIGEKPFDYHVNEQLSFHELKHEHDGKGGSSNMLAKVLISYNKQKITLVIVRKMRCRSIYGLFVWELCVGKVLLFAFDPGGNSCHLRAWSWRALFSRNWGGLYEAIRISCSRPLCYLCVNVEYFHESWRNEVQVRMDALFVLFILLSANLVANWFDEMPNMFSIEPNEEHNGLKSREISVVCLSKDLRYEDYVSGVSSTNFSSMAKFGVQSVSFLSGD